MEISKFIIMLDFSKSKEIFYKKAVIMIRTQTITVYKMLDGSFSAIANIIGYHWCAYTCDHTGVRIGPERDDMICDSRKEAVNTLKNGLVGV